MQASEEVIYEDLFAMEQNSCYDSSNLNTKEPYVMEQNSCYGSSNLNTSNNSESPVVNNGRKGGFSKRQKKYAASNYSFFCYGYCNYFLYYLHYVSKEL